MSSCGLRVRRDLHIDTLRLDDVVVVVVRGPDGANAHHPGLVAFIHFHRHLQPEVIFHVDIERSGVIRLQKRRCDLCRQGERNNSAITGTDEGMASLF